MDRATGKTDRELIQEIWNWTFGNGRPGAERRIAELERRQGTVATREDIGYVDVDIKRRVEQIETRLERRIDALSTQITAKAVIEIAIIVGTIVGLFFLQG